MHRIVRFGSFEVDLMSGELRKNGIRIHLREQSFRALALLLEQPGQVVTREELRRRLWPADVFVDFENNLNHAIARLREALGDSAERPRFIETLPKRGYRLLVGVSEGIPLPHPPPAPRVRVVVLPFVDLSGDPAQEYFSDAMTEEVITAIAALAPDLGVIARTTTMRYKGAHKDVARIGRELRVDYICEGGVRREGDRIILTVQLIRVSDQTHVFARRYDADVHTVFEMRALISEAIASHLEADAGVPRNRPPAAIAPGMRKPTEDFAAYTEYIRGRSLLEKVTPEALAHARQHFENAIARDPGFALAHDAVAELYSYLGYFGYMRPKDAFSIGVSHALAAVETDDTLAEAHALLAEYHKQLDYSWPAAERQMARALELNRTSPIVRVRYAVSVLMPRNRIDEAVAEIEHALESDPLSAFARTWLGVMLLLGREYDRAIDEARRVLQIEPTTCWAPFIIGCAYRQKHFNRSIGRDGRAAAGTSEPDFAEEAIRAHRRAIELSPGTDFFVGWLGLAYGVCGRETEARAVLQRLHRSERYNLPTGFGHVHLGLGETDAAFEWFDRAVEERDQIMMPILSYAHFDPIRDDPRFGALLRKMKLR